jgi:hypothetical protein
MARRTPYPLILTYDGIDYDTCWIQVRGGASRGWAKKSYGIDVLFLSMIVFFLLGFSF